MKFKSTGDGTSKEMTFECDGSSATYGPWMVAASHRNRPVAQMDWFSDRLQILIETEDDDEPPIRIRFNPDGSFAEIAIDPRLMMLVKSSSDRSPWVTERDSHEQLEHNQKGEAHD